MTLRIEHLSGSQILRVTREFDTPIALKKSIEITEIGNMSEVTQGLVNDVCTSLSSLDASLKVPRFQLPSFVSNILGNLDPPEEELVREGLKTFIPPSSEDMGSWERPEDNSKIFKIGFSGSR